MDSYCQAAPLYGGMRHTCGVDATGLPICEGFRIEPRRINIRPDGVEFVLAESTGDPQFALMSTRTIPALGFGNSSGLSVCAYNRFDPMRVGDQPIAVPVIFPLERGESEDLALDSTRRFCRPDEPECIGICPQTGTVCQLGPLTAAGFVWPGGDYVRCRFGSCCNAVGQCAGE